MSVLRKFYKTAVQILYGSECSGHENGTNDVRSGDEDAKMDV